MLGLSSYGEAFKEVTHSSIEGVSKFLKVTCSPLLEELGMWAHDRIRIWRFINLCNVLEKAKGKVVYEEGEIKMVNPRIGLAIAENASLIEEAEIQEMWAGLFAASMSPDGKGDSNLSFVNILKQLTTLQVRILKYAYENTKKVIYDNGLVSGCKYCITLEEAYSLFQINDLNLLDRELDLLRYLGLIEEGINLGKKDVEINLSLTSLGIYFVSKCQGESYLDTSTYMTEREFYAHPEYQTSSFLALE